MAWNLIYPCVAHGAQFSRQIKGDRITVRPRAIDDDIAARLALAERLPLTSTAISRAAHDGTRTRIFALTGCAAENSSRTSGWKGNVVIIFRPSNCPFCSQRTVEGSNRFTYTPSGAIE